MNLWRCLVYDSYDGEEKEIVLRFKPRVGKDIMVASLLPEHYKVVVLLKVSDFKEKK